MGFMWLTVVLFCMSVTCVNNMGGSRRRGGNLKSRSLHPTNWWEFSDHDAEKIRQFFADNCEKQLNDQIKLEFEASQVYMSMSNYLDRWDVALPGFAKKFRKFSDEEREHGIKLMQYINKRGGLSKMPQVLDVSQYSQYMDINHWGTIMNVLATSLELERLVNYKIVDFVRTCASVQNFHMENFIDEQFITEQVDAIEELGRMITKLKMVGISHVDNFGLYQLDKDIGEQ